LTDENNSLRAKSNDLVSQNRELEMRLNSMIMRSNDAELTLSHQKKVINESSQINLYYDNADRSAE